MYGLCCPRQEFYHISSTAVAIARGIKKKKRKKTLVMRTYLINYNLYSSEVSTRKYVLRTITICDTRDCRYTKSTLKRFKNTDYDDDDQ